MRRAFRDDADKRATRNDKKKNATAATARGGPRPKYPRPK